MSEEEKPVKTRKKLIEVALPLPEINDASAYDKMPGIGPHPKGIHHWWARLPLPVARAVLFASVVDDPSAAPGKFTSEEAQDRERERLFDIIRKLMQKQLHKHPDVYAQARAEMVKYCEGSLPIVFDPFAGGGSIPLEAARLGFEALAGDLNPIPVLLNQCDLEVVAQWAERPPLNAQDRGKIGGEHGWRATSGLAADVRYYGRIVLERAKSTIGKLYPSIGVSSELAAGRSDLKSVIGKALPVAAWIWARTVPSPNPAARGAHVPLISTFWLSSKKGGEAWLEPIVDRAAGTWRFSVRTGVPEHRAVIGSGTKTGRSGFRCLLSDDPIPFDYIRAQGESGQIGTTLVAIVADTARSKAYLPSTIEHIQTANTVAPSGFPDTDLPAAALGFRVQNYGIRKHWQMFTPRQLTGMVALSNAIRDIRLDVKRDAASTGMSVPETEQYVRAISTFLALALDRCADFNNSLCRWSSSNQKVMNLFGRHAIPMVWDFAEANLLGDSVGAWETCSDYVAKCIEVISTGSNVAGRARQVDAATGANGIKNLLVSTDPPYYDNIGYAALSDFFYIWLRRTIGDLDSDLFSTVLVPKSQELTASPELFNGSKEEAKGHFEAGFRKAFAALRDKMNHNFPLTVYYAFKQDDEESEADDESENVGPRIDRTTGWETMLEALIGTGFQITATWPVRASQAWRMRAMGSNALASYIVLACRTRPDDAPQTDRRSFIAELKRELPAALHHLQQGNVVPVDFAQAAIGPGMFIYSRYSRILETSGKNMTVRTALALINQTLTEVLSEQEDEFDSKTRWAIAWFEQFGFGDGDFGDAEVLSKAKVTTLASLVQAGLVLSRAGKVRLLRPEELPSEWNFDRDSRLAVWEAVHYLIRAEAQGGEMAAAALVARLGSRADAARELAYRLYLLCERKKRAQDALAYNGLVQSWPEIQRLASEAARTPAPQPEPTLFG